MLEDRILFIDGEAIVLDKPAGLAVHAGPSTPRSLEDFLPDLRFGFHRAPTPVHRLDRDTSGCLLLARNPKAHKRFSAEFEAGRVEKTYLAVLAGVPELTEGMIDLPLAKISSREAGWRMVPDPKGQRAVTRWAVVAQAGGRALVRFTPETGRTHQLRVHAASGLGLPILGDPVYGNGQGSGTLLHAVAIRVERAAKPAVEARAPMPAPFIDLGFGDAGL
jgi:tRNA pseudouridine32 synthase/23S rRNA pseudouridine746 synthase